MFWNCNIVVVVVISAAVAIAVKVMLRASRSRGPAYHRVTSRVLQSPAQSSQSIPFDRSLRLLSSFHSFLAYRSCSSLVCPSTPTPFRLMYLVPDFSIIYKYWSCHINQSVSASGCEIRAFARPQSLHRTTTTAAVSHCWVAVWRRFRCGGDEFC